MWFRRNPVQQLRVLQGALATHLEKSQKTVPIGDALHASGSSRFGFGHRWRAPAVLPTNDVLTLEAEIGFLDSGKIFGDVLFVCLFGIQQIQKMRVPLLKGNGRRSTELNWSLM